MQIWQYRNRYAFFMDDIDKGQGVGHNKKGNKKLQKNGNREKKFMD